MSFATAEEPCRVLAGIAAVGPPAIRGESDIDLVYTDHDIATDWGHRLSPAVKPAWSPELLQGVTTSTI